MCEECKHIDERIARYRLLGNQITDEQTLDGIDRLIQELKAQRRRLHPDEQS
jgi:hypothetical protein